MSKPAARIGDFHACPMVTPGTPPIPHVGGPITGPGVPNVLICGMPAATMGDMCTCVGPPDTIVLGSVGVFIGGKPAARMGDMCAHGGMIAVGAPTVLIGDFLASPSSVAVVAGLQALCVNIAELEQLTGADRLLELQALEKAMRSTDPAAADQLAQGRHTLEMAMLANASYSPEDLDRLPPGYSMASDDDLGRLGLSRDDMPPDQQLYRTTRADGTDHYVMAFRGTVPTNAGDWATNVLQGLGFQDESYTRSVASARTMSSSGQSIEFTGHSKGGGQAAAASAISGTPATTFNSAGVHHETLRREGMSDEQISAANEQVNAYNNERDPLSFAQDNRELVVGGMGVSGGLLSKLGPVGAALGTGLQILADYALLTGGVPRAMGARYTVPAHRDQSMNPLDGHSQAEMILALEEQQDANLNAVCGC